MHHLTPGGEENQDFLEIGLVDECHIGETDQVGQDDREGWSQSVKELAQLVRGGGPIFQKPSHGVVLVLQLASDVSEIGSPCLDRIRGVDLGIEDRLGLIDNCGERI